MGHTAEAGEARDSGFEVATTEDGTVLRIGSSSSPQAIATAIANAILAGQRVQMRAIGAGAVNQAVKAAAVARGLVASQGVDLTVRPGFTKVFMADVNEERTAVTLLVVKD